MLPRIAATALILACAGCATTGPGAETEEILPVPPCTTNTCAVDPARQPATSEAAHGRCGSDIPAAARAEPAASPCCAASAAVAPAKSSGGSPDRPAKVSAAISRPAAVDIEFIYLDDLTCDRCRDTERELDAALAEARSLLSAAGADVSVRKIHITSVAEAQAQRFRSSPTIRVGARDIELVPKESACVACSELAGREIDCRVWTWRGKEYPIPPKQMILDAVLRAFYAPPTENAEAAYELPQNIREFFARPRPEARASPGPR